MAEQNIKQRDLSHLDRNLDSLVQELATRAHRIFFEAANATARSAVLRSKVNVNPDYFAENTTLLRAVESNSSALIRERTVLEPGQVKLKRLSPCHMLSDAVGSQIHTVLVITAAPCCRSLIP